MEFDWSSRKSIAIGCRRRSSVHFFKDDLEICFSNFDLQRRGYFFPLKPEIEYLPVVLVVLNLEKLKIQITANIFK